MWNLLLVSQGNVAVTWLKRLLLLPGALCRWVEWCPEVAVKFACLYNQGRTWPQRARPAWGSQSRPCMAATLSEVVSSHLGSGVAWAVC